MPLAVVSPPNTFMENLEIRWPLAEPGELVEKRPIILDGGMGRELLRMGAPFRQPEWSALALIEAPEFVIRAHAAFAAAGAEVLTTSNYAVVPSCLGPSRFAAQGSSLADLAGRLARQAAQEARDPVRIAGSLPPLFGSYRPDLFDPTAAEPLLARLIDALDPHVDPGSPRP